MTEQARENVLALDDLVKQMEVRVRRLKGDLGLEDPINKPPSVRPVPDPPAYSFGGEEIRKDVCRDPHKLLKPFADKVETLFERLRARGEDPLCWETWRSAERAQGLSDRGAGVKLSTHCLGLACDIVHAEDYWSAGRSFWDAVGEEAEALGLTWGGRWRRRDFPHVQAVAVKDQAKVRRMSEQERIAFLTGSTIPPATTDSTG